MLPRVRHLENGRRFLAAGQWADAVDAIRRAGETEPARLVKVEMSKAQLGFEPMFQ